MTTFKTVPDAISKINNETFQKEKGKKKKKKVNRAFRQAVYQKVIIFYRLAERTFQSQVLEW